ncbi:PepSY-associated TM helix domain-containing protein [Pseudoalteromonas denitrificans]|uniref:Uncharacterized iron-regulated membrane protein n=1 Tax=Pseudoalteromonas denitrificans DSM 6059 TaxID=1123010 RepID=A0A1I1KJ48_9GAMM|nr:PepSY-associated TM helix domain-containing protein [Pseudoalteromonas denitrificans]SFC60896.1 Uncharacterized iron-regulated membrane protein [Pseudoalteromonas denitrificans DSM 6059]
MNKTFLKRITDAHSWLGLIISGLLFIVFFAGSISLFRAEITQWSMQPHFEPTKGAFLPVSEILKIAIKDRDFDPKEHLTLIKPSKHIPYYKAYVDIQHQPGEEDHDALLIDPVSGEIVASIDDFFLADFIYDLHIDLNIPAGKYIIGFVTLFFFFALVSGIFIHARKLFINFFKYRSKHNKRSQLLDMHNVVGVMSLPFTIMYAISGLIFNLVIIYQIAFALVLYKGDQQALLDDAGYQAIEPQWVDKTWNKPDLDQILQKITNEYGTLPRMIRVYNYGDESAVVHTIGKIEQAFAQKFETAITVKDQHTLFTKDAQNPNTLVQGLYVISQLHFGDFAGFDLRILYFLLGLGVCGLIITGNLLWIEQRSRQRNHSPKTLKFVNNFTLWSTGGIVLATAVSFMTERLLPVNLTTRPDYMVYSFIITLALVACLLPLSRNKKVFLGYLLTSTALLLLSLVVIDWIMFANEIINLWQQGINTVIGLQIGFIFLAIILAFAGIKLTNQKHNPDVLENEMIDTCELAG